MTTKLERFTLKAREEPRTRFNALMGMLFDPEGLRESFERQFLFTGPASALGR